MGTTKKTCGVVMPMSECDGRPAAHWSDVLAIISSAASEANFIARLVSDTNESNLIHKEILQNIYNDEVIICDVSGRNPNVFFELGIRMATQKATLIIKDDKTDYPFDTSPNRYIQYPRDLRHPLMEAFRKQLSSALEKTEDFKPETSFIGQLGPFHIPNVESKQVPLNEAILERLEGIERRLPRPVIRESSRLRSDFIESPAISVRHLGKSRVSECARGYSIDSINNGIKDFLQEPGRENLKAEKVSSKGELHFHFELFGKDVTTQNTRDAITDAIDSAIPF